MKEIVYNNNDYDVYTLGDSTIITPKGHSGKLMSAEALLLALKNNRAVTSYSSLIDEVGVIIDRLEVVEGKEVIIIETDNIPTSIEDRILPNEASECPDFIMDYREYMAREDRYNDKPKFNANMAARKVGPVTTARRDKIAIIIAIVIAILILMPLIYTVNRDLNKTLKFQNWQKEHRNNLR